MKVHVRLIKQPFQLYNIKTVNTVPWHGWENWYFPQDFTALVKEMAIKVTIITRATTIPFSIGCFKKVVIKSS
jgi:hypothetical protein